MAALVKVESGSLLPSGDGDSHAHALISYPISVRDRKRVGGASAPDPTVETWLLSCLFFYGVQAAYSVTLGIGAGCAFLMRSGVQ